MRNIVFNVILLLTVISCLFTTFYCKKDGICVAMNYKNTSSNSNKHFIKKIIIINKMKRNYYVSLPPDYNPDKSYPVLFVFHGGLRNAISILETTEFRKYQKDYDFIIVAPNGLGRFNQESFLSWNAGNCGYYAHFLHADEPLFVKSIIEEVSKTYNIDKKRIYLTGMSNGAMLCYKLVHALPGVFAGIAPVAGALNREKLSVNKPLPVIIFHGTEDKRILFDGGIPTDFLEEKSRIDKPVSYAVNFWVKNNKCDPKPQITYQKNVIIYKYANCEQNATVTLYKILGGRHAWPGGKKDFIFGDKPSNDINASKIILDAFINKKY